MRGERPNSGGMSLKNIMSEIDASLKRLNLDYIDIYQTHRYDGITPFE